MEKKIVAIGITDCHRDRNNLKIMDNIDDQLLDLCKELDVKVIFNLGDVFESRIEQPESVLNSVGNSIAKFGNEGIETFCIAGNHDKTSYLSESSFLDEFRFHPNFTLIKNVFKLKYIDNIYYWFIPYFDESELYTDILKSAIKSMSTLDKNSSTKHILLTHIAIRGAKNNNGEVIQNHINSSLFKVFYKVYVGHFHDRNEFDNIVYIGAPRQKLFSEDNKKGFCIFYNDGSHEFIQSKFKEYCTRCFKLSEEGTLGRINDTLLDYKKVKEEEQDNFYLRFDISGKEEDIAKLDQYTLKKEGIDLKIRKVVEEQEVISVKNLKLNKEEISEEFDKWATKEKPQNLKLGKKYLNKQLNSIL